MLKTEETLNRTDAETSSAWRFGMGTSHLVCQLAQQLQ